MVNVLSLKRLKLFAQSRAAVVFDVADDKQCLACQAANAERPGHVMGGWTYFSPAPSYSQVDVLYGALTRELFHRDATTITGADLALMIGELVAGTHPRQVADEYVERAA